MIPVNLTPAQMLRLVARHYRAGKPLSSEDADTIGESLDSIRWPSERQATEASGLVCLSPLADTCTVSARHYAASRCESLARDIERAS